MFIILSLGFHYPILSGQEIIQNDIIQYKGGAHELLDYREKTAGDETYWSNSMFGGMPTYQMGAKFKGDFIKELDTWIQFLPRPANYLFLLLSGFWLLIWTLTRRGLYAFLGAIMFAFSTYFFIIVAAGHNAKVHTIGYFAPLLAGICMLYFRRWYLAGGVVTCLSLALQISANHPQMTYYLFMVLGIFFIIQCVRMLMGRLEKSIFWKGTGIFTLAVILSIGMNAPRLLANAEYVGETVRGKQILNKNKGRNPEGIDRDALLMWSYGKLETLNLFVPNLMGGGSQQAFSEDFTQNLALALEDKVQDPIQLEQAVQSIQSQVSPYWGDQPGTSGPAYQGIIVMFLGILAGFLVWDKYRWWYLASIILSILLAWGSNFPWLSDLFIDFVPMYNKFRAPSSILVLAEFLIPMMGVIGLYRILEVRDIPEVKVKKILIGVSIGFLSFLLILLLFGNKLLIFANEVEKVQIPEFILSVLKTERQTLLVHDTLRALALLLPAIGLVWFAFVKKIKSEYAVVGLILLSLIDLWGVGRRYLNHNNFVDSSFTQYPFPTDLNKDAIHQAKEKPELQRILAMVPMNRILSEIRQKDRGYYRVYNPLIGSFNETNTSNFHSSIGGYHAVKLRRYDDLIDKYFYQQKDSLQTAQILSMLNTRYHLTGDYNQPAVIKTQPNGAAWLVEKVTKVNTPEEEIQKIGQIDTRKELVVSDTHPNIPVNRDIKAQIQLATYQPNHLIYRYNSESPQVAVFSEIWYPYGWNFYIDGKKSSLFRANYLLRAASLPAGKHTLEMKFQPDVITKGQILSLISLIIGLIAFGGGFWLHRRKQNELRSN